MSPSSLTLTSALALLRRLFRTLSTTSATSSSRRCSSLPSSSVRSPRRLASVKRWWRARPPRERARLALSFVILLTLWHVCLSRVWWGLVSDVAGYAPEARAPMTDMAITRATVGRLDKFDDHDYSQVFTQLGLRASEKRPYILSWDYLSLNKRNVTDITWQMGQYYHDQVTVYKPLCVNVRTGVAHAIAGEKRCLGFNRSYSHFENRCGFKRSIARGANGLRMGRDRKPEWLDRNADTIRWVKGLTVLQGLDKSCANIAHFMGRVLFLHHVLSNVEAYSMPPRNPANVLVLADRATMKRFKHPENYNYYHYRLLSALVSPHNFTVAPLDAFLEADMEDRPHGSGPLHFLMRNLTLVNREDDSEDQGPAKRNSGGNEGNTNNNNYKNNGNRNGGSDPQGRDGEGVAGVEQGSDDSVEVMDKRPDSDVKYVCFKRVIIPSFLRGRFFISDFEYPSAKASIISTVSSAPRVPRDSIRLRARLNAWHDAQVGFRPRRRVVMLFDRKGSRRSFDVAGRAQFLQLLRRVGASRGYRVAVRDFAGVSFDQQYGEVRQVAVGVGIHGANLANAVFMPPLSALVEIFPHGFSHVMYRGGGNAGLKYFSYEMSKAAGGDYDKVGNFGSVEECVYKDTECKKFYRDATVVVRQEDIDALGDLLGKAIDWSESLP